ncbi:neuferricin [Ambystoma mexicanum]|uniref:neuferricin n=1 Tax=Ambystoma mexicanum TaxID=8296 RepID=UPI0037E790FC
MLGYLSAAAICLTAVLLIGWDPWPLANLPGVSYLFPPPEECAIPERPPERLLSRTELARYRGEDGGLGLYLALLGQVFDVQRGRIHYGPGGSYSFFAGRDASRAYVTGDFTETGLVDDLSGLTPLEMINVKNWLSFYYKNYVYIGNLIGRFYDESGRPTEALRAAEAVAEEGLKLKAQSDEEKKQFPPCNSEWTSTTGSRVWCSKQSGGIERDWIGVPRKLYKPGAKSHRCVCVRTTGPPTGQLEHGEHTDRGDLDDPSLQQYEDCHPLFEWCKLKD